VFQPAGAGSRRPGLSSLRLLFCDFGALSKALRERVSGAFRLSSFLGADGVAGWGTFS